MHTFSITIQRPFASRRPKEEDQPQEEFRNRVVTYEGEPGLMAHVQHEGYLQLDRQRLTAAEADQSKYGQLLGEAIFHADVRDAFLTAQAHAAGTLHVFLSVEDPDLKGLRWERSMCSHPKGLGPSAAAGASAIFNPSSVGSRCTISGD